MSAIKNVLVFTVGFASGVAATCFVASRFVELEFVTEPEAENTENDMTKNPEGDISENFVVLESTTLSPSKEDDYVNYTVVSENEDEADSDDPEKDIPAEVEVFGDPEAVPFVTTATEYGTEFDYDEIDLNYYISEDLLTDCWNYPVEDVERTVGNDAIEQCRNGDADMVYVKNDRLKAYYEIIKIDQPYPGVSG